MDQTELGAGPNQTMVLYRPADTAEEVDPLAIFTGVAADAADRAASGWHIVSTAVMPLRHAATFMGRDGSGYQTKTSVLVVYARS